MKTEEIIRELKKQYPENENKTNNIEKLLEQLQPLTDKKEITEIIEELQEEINKLYIIKDADILIDLQVIINEYRNKYDITDPREIVNIDEGQEFVQ